MTDPDSTTDVVETQPGDMPMTPCRLTPLALAELDARAADQDASDEMLRAAKALVMARKIHRLGPDTWAVIGSLKEGATEGTRYTIEAGKCSCPAFPRTNATWRCYHRLGIALYGWVEKAMQDAQQPMYQEDAIMPTALPDTHATETAQDAPGDAIMANTALDMPQETDASETPQDGLEAMREGADISPAMPYSLPCLTPDLTVVSLPGGGERTRTIGYLMAALARAQLRMRNPGKDATNPHLGNRYASMAETRDATIPPLAAEGIGVTQWVSVADGELICWTMLGHASGEYQLTPLPVPCPKGELRGQTPIQMRGSAISYAKRYGLQAVAMVVGDLEDDGNDTGKESKSSSANGQAASGRIVPETLSPASRPPALPEDALRTLLRKQIEDIWEARGRDVEQSWISAQTHFGRSRDDFDEDTLMTIKVRLLDRQKAEAVTK